MAALTRDRAMLHQFATTDSVTFPCPGGGMETVSARSAWRDCVDIPVLSNTELGAHSCPPGPARASLM